MMQTQTPADQAAAGPSRPYKRPACNSCRVAHVACENARPCHRCNLLGKGEMCQDANVKKRGRPRKSAAPGTPKGSRTDEDPSPCSKRARTGNDPKPALPAVLPRPTSAAASSTAATTTAAATSDSTIGHHSPPPPLAASAAPSADLPRLPPPSSLLRLGQQTDFPSTLSSTTLPPLPPLSAAPAAPFLYPSFIISLFQNAAGVTPLGASTSPPQPQQLQQAVAAPLASRPTTTPAPTQAPAVTAGADARGGFSEANLMHILDSIKEIRETNEQLRKEMSEIKHENAFLKKEKEELRVKLEEHLAQEQ